ncbi:MAG: Ribonuclease J 1 [Parcubacteria group bacterium ADurb.Bin305]|jgi:ribonuclease J|nr:MAG: Ribonuclease J 1 [Parcubacteria group bacterium ADurb.Bin305]
MITPKEKHPSSIVRIIPLGGLEEIGRNMTLIEYNNEVIIIDAGLQFPDENTPGIDFIIPNISYLTNHPEKKVLALFITHAHYDHIGAIPYLIAQLNYPPIYATPLAKAIILKRQEDFPYLKKLTINTFNIDKNETIFKGAFKIQPFHLNHNIPETAGFAITTPQGLIMYATDYKFDFQPIADKPANLNQIARLAGKDTELLMSDSTNVEMPGHSISESAIMENLDKIFAQAEGRIILATFSSLISRLQQAITLSEKYNRKVVVEGFSMKTNLNIAHKLGYLKTQKGTIINWKEAERINPKNLTVLCTGAQGESEATLMKIVNREHRYLTIKKNDSVIFSSSIVPGNELAVQSLIDSLNKQGANVYHYKILDIHSSGHAYQEDLKMMINLVKPRFFMPIHGHFSKLKEHCRLAESVGVPSANIVLATNGQIVEMAQNNVTVTQKFVPANYIMVDGLGVGDVQEIVLRDRQTLAQDGIFIIIATIDKKTGLLYQEPEVISRGFVYMKESQELIGETKKKIREIIQRLAKDGETADSYTRNILREEIGASLLKKTQRRPMVLPIIIKV